MSSLSAENKVVVRILGEEYPIIGADDPAYISRVASLVDSRMQEVARQCRSQARDKIAILTALSLASELLERSEKLERATSTQSESLHGLLAQIDKALEKS
ncbi:MAG: cell division protein ZapA [Candidatus Zixiibacteriota bacterium]